MGRPIADDRATAITRLTGARVAHLGTRGPDGEVRLVPICFAVDGDRIVAAVDHKPKRTLQLARLADMEQTGRATVLVDHYDDTDWSELWWVRVTGRASVHASGDALAMMTVRRLAHKYAQYRETPPAGPTYSITIEHLTWWSATP
ncbi:MAG TPA: TIGR03668 family PPOX class F420-dependent oxidoreductase [Acidimicrobiia bacterium]